MSGLLRVPLRSPTAAASPIYIFPMLPKWVSAHPGKGPLIPNKHDACQRRPGSAMLVLLAIPSNGSGDGLREARQWREAKNVPGAGDVSDLAGLARWSAQIPAEGDVSAAGGDHGFGNLADRVADAAAKIDRPLAEAALIGSEQTVHHVID